MSFDTHQDLAYGTVLTAPSPALSGNTLVLNAGQGALFGTPPFPISIHAAGATEAQIATGAEIGYCTARSTDTLTFTRNTSGPNGARTILVGDVVIAGPVSKTVLDIEKAIPKNYLFKPAAAVTLTGTAFISFSTPVEITNVVVAAGQNVKLKFTGAVYGGGQDGRLAFYRGTTALTSNLTPNAGYQVALEWVDENPGAGTYTYEIKGLVFGGATLTIEQNLTSTADSVPGTSIMTAEVYTP